MEIEIITDIEQEPLTLDEVRKYLRITTTSQDDVLEMLITSARERLERYTNLNFGVKTMKVRWDSLNSLQYGQELPYQPNAVIDTVLDDDDNEIDYEEKGLNYKKIYLIGTEGVNVTYDSGFETLPSGLKNALLKEIATEYENRDNITFESSQLMSNDAQALAYRFSRNLLFGI
jgi:hypothetical protein